MKVLIDMFAGHILVRLGCSIVVLMNLQAIYHLLPQFL